MALTSIRSLIGYLPESVQTAAGPGLAGGQDTQRPSEVSAVASAWLRAFRGAVDWDGA